MIKRRTFLQGLAATLAVPVVAKAVTCELARVDASYQSGSSLVVSPLRAALDVGDIITIDGVERWYRVDNTPTRHLRQFVVVQKAEPGHRVVHLYPPMLGEYDKKRRTIVNLPMNKAEIRRVS